MGNENLKLELIEWIAKLEDDQIIRYLKAVKDSKPDNHVWWEELDASRRKGIEMGLEDIDKGRFIPHDEVKKKFRL